ncbi:MAG: MBL fold metallo-hydrolase [Gemmatimonadales bacterium]
MSRVTTMRVGGLVVHALDGGTQRLDGGAMFGVVPKPLWERRIKADALNRIALTMRCLLVEHDDGLVLIDNGVGNKESDKFIEIYGIENAGAGGRTAIEDAIAELGHRPADIRTVINTHLHFDHAGGNTFIAADDPHSRVQLAFPNARYVMHRREYEWAGTGNERTTASYLPNNFLPVLEAGKVQFLEGERDTVVPGIRTLVTPGHTPSHMSIMIENGGDVLLFPADTVPTAHHLPLPWIMGYDVEPIRTLESKRAMYERGMAEGWQVVFEHDADTVGGRLEEGDRGVTLGERLPAAPKTGARG